MAGNRPLKNTILGGIYMDRGILLKGDWRKAATMPSRNNYGHSLIYTLWLVTLESGEILEAVTTRLFGDDVIVEVNATA